MKTAQVKNRWLIALAAVGIHISIGSVYAWSVFSNPLHEAFGWDLQQISLTFGIAIFFLGASAAVMGHVVEKKGPRFTGMIAATFFGIGIAGAGVAVAMESLYMLYFSYGVLAGIGLGMGYVTPVSTLIKWFPDRRGLATGLAIMGFGFASMIASPVIQALISAVGLSSTFYIMGATYFVVMLSASLYLERPPEGWKPDSMVETKENGAAAKKPAGDLNQSSANDAVRTPTFWGLWVMIFINITCGIAIISAASPMAQEIAGLTAMEAATMVGVMGLLNGLGRLLWSAASDYLTRPNTFMLFFVIQIGAFFMLPSLSNAIAFQIVVFVIMTCYGGGFSTLPAYIGDLFGTKQLGAIHGYVLTAWALAGLSGSSLAAFVRNLTGSYTMTMYIFVGILTVALAISVVMKVHVAKVLRAKEQEAVEATPVTA
ncbi:OFA family MFS transporter [Photobacterium lutimaris]|uniref:MFS transporter n=1 Tax=Photobacterium lutimaris TaxID=388278 RepID=A0A2T3J138_9GAMM|nr:OFA family MFS transporter [Photobacterium lutimaris]PSU34802.1 MFS transporter [Photobacterium lutimaris]TDR77130.1 OFA family oxalate/formate antiporter-like MFS transporter [Photobacterium lutimaris]